MKKSKLLLSFAIALCSVGVLSSGGMEVKKVEAAESSFTVKFITQANDSSTAGIELKHVSEGSEFIESFTCSKAYPGKEGVKLGSKNAAGSLTVKFKKVYIITNVNVVTAKYGSDTGYIKVEEINDSKYVFGDTYDFKFNGGLETDNLKFSTSEKRGYLTSFTVTYSDTPVVSSPEAEISTIDDATYTKVGGDNIQFTSELKNVETAPTPVYTSSDDTIASFDGANLVPHKMGKVTATVTYKVGETDYSKSMDVIIYPDNTNPLTVAEALTVCEYTGSNNAPYDYAVRGIISGAKYNSDYKNTDAYLNDLDGEASIKIFRAAATSENDIVDGKYYEFRGNLLKYGDTKEIANCESSDYNVLPLPLDYAYSNVSALSQLSFAFEKEAEGTFGGFTNMSLNFKTAFDFTEYTKGTDYEEAGMMFVKGSDVSATYSKKTAEALPEGAIKATQTDYSKAFIVRLEDIPVSDWETKVTVVPYILVDGTYYFGTASATSVIEVAGAYSTSEATITLSDESVVNVKDVAAAIAVYYEANKQ